LATILDRDPWEREVGHPVVFVEMLLPYSEERKLSVFVRFETKPSNYS
jgi:hypothetical protein